MALYTLMVFWFGNGAIDEDSIGATYLPTMIDFMDYYTVNARIEPFDPHVQSPSDVINTLWDDVVG